jgi:hypothetical protein
MGGQFVKIGGQLVWKNGDKLHYRNNVVTTANTKKPSSTRTAAEKKPSVAEKSKECRQGKVYNKNTKRCRESKRPAKTAETTVEPKPLDEETLFGIVRELKGLYIRGDPVVLSTPDHMTRVGNQLLKAMIPILYHVSISPGFPQPADIKLPKSSPFWKMHASVRDILRKNPGISEKQFVTKMQRLMTEIITPKPVTFPHLSTIQRHLQPVRNGTQRLEQVIPRIEDGINLPRGSLSQSASPLRAYIERLLKNPAPSVVGVTNTENTTVEYKIPIARLVQGERSRNSGERILKMPKQCTLEYLMYYIAEQLGKLPNGQRYFALDFDLPYAKQELNRRYGDNGTYIWKFGPQQNDRYAIMIAGEARVITRYGVYFDVQSKQLIRSDSGQSRLLFNMCKLVQEPIQEAYNNIFGRDRYKVDMLMAKHRPAPLKAENVRWLASHYHNIPRGKTTKQFLIEELKKRNAVYSISKDVYMKDEYDRALAHVGNLVSRSRACPNNEFILEMSEFGTPDTLRSRTIPGITTISACVPTTATMQDLHKRLHPKILEQYPQARYCYIICTLDKDIDDNSDKSPSLLYESILKDHDKRSMKLQRWKLHIQIEKTTEPFFTAGCVDIKTNTIVPLQKARWDDNAAVLWKYIQSVKDLGYIMTLEPPPPRSGKEIHLQVTKEGGTCKNKQKTIVFCNPEGQSNGPVLPMHIPGIEFKHVIKVDERDVNYGLDVKVPKFDAPVWYEVCIPDKMPSTTKLADILKPQIQRLLGVNERISVRVSAGKHRLSVYVDIE